MKRVTILIISFLLLLPPLSTYVKGDISPDPNYLTSLTTLGSFQESYLDEVNVTMFVNKDKADGEGSFKITNPSNGWENFSVVFDPGAETFNLRHEDNSDFNYVRYENFYGENWSVYGINFNVSIPPNGSIYANLTWRYNVNQDNHKNWDYHTHRLVEYLIIGMMGWSRPITVVDVSFIMVTDSYDRAISKTPIIQTITDDKDRKVYHYHAKNFSDDKLLLQVVFMDEEEFNPTGVAYLQCTVSILFVCGVIGLIYYIYRNGKKKKEKQEQQEGRVKAK